MKQIKYISIFILLFGFSFALVQCTKEENVNENKDQIALNSADVIKTLNKSGIYNLKEAEMELREPHISGCYNGGTFCTPYFFRDTIAVLNYCDYVQVKYIMWVCPDGIKFSDFEANTLGGCDSLTHSWLYLDEGELDHQLELFNYNASLIVEEMVLSNILRQYNILCQFGSVMHSSFYRNLCYRWCVWFDYGKNGEVTTSLVKNYCGDKCCAKATRWCIDENGKVEHSNPVFSNVGNGVCNNIPYPVQCRGYQIGVCSKECGAP